MLSSKCNSAIRCEPISLLPHVDFRYSIQKGVSFLITSSKNLTPDKRLTAIITDFNFHWDRTNRTRILIRWMVWKPRIETRLYSRSYKVLMRSWVVGFGRVKASSSFGLAMYSAAGWSGWLIIMGNKYSRQQQQASSVEDALNSRPNSIDTQVVDILCPFAAISPMTRQRRRVLYLLVEMDIRWSALKIFISCIGNGYKYSLCL